MGGNPSTASLRFPRYLKLKEHGELRSVIIVGNLTELQEVEEICRAAVIQCDHEGVLGGCIEIEPATIDDWMDYH